MNQHHLIKKQRTELVLLTLNKLGCANRKQLQRICKLGKIRNANRILKDMADDGLLIVARSMENLYRLSKKGRQLIGSDDPGNRLTDGNIQHTLMRNDAYIFFNMPSTWEKEKRTKIKTDKEILLIPDAYFNAGGTHYFIEADRTQSMEKNKEKLQHYYHLQNIFRLKKEPIPKIYFITTTEARSKRLQALVKETNTDVMVLLHTDIN
jgi:hypothetical protein